MKIKSDTVNTKPTFKRCKASDPNMNNPDICTQSPIQKLRSAQLTPHQQSIVYMSLCMGIHFAGHELARAPIQSLFTSKQIGFQNPAALPLAVGTVSPFSILVLVLYKRTLKKFGPRLALNGSTMIYSSFLLIATFLLKYMRVHELEAVSKLGNLVNEVTHKDTITFGKLLIFGMFVVQSANVQFLYTQHWSFLGSVMTPEEGKVWFAPIAGVGSITSTLAAGNVRYFVDKMGLLGLLSTAAITIGASAFFADKAYGISRKNGFEPSNDGLLKKDDDKKATNDKRKNSDDIQAKDSNDDGQKKKKSSIDLFQRVPILRAMFFEVILSQCLSSVLNLQFMIKVKDTILDDSVRAGWTGGCYAWINGISGVMQFFILPTITKRVHISYLWLLMPSIMLLFTTLQQYADNPSLTLVGCTFLSMKTIEYSLRGQVSETVFASLDYESRFIGKQRINLFANRLGKSATAASLFLLATYMEKEGRELDKLLVMVSNVIAGLWLFATLQLTKCINDK